LEKNISENMGYFDLRGISKMKVGGGSDLMFETRKMIQRNEKKLRMKSQ